MRTAIATTFLGACALTHAALPVGDLTHDGPPTPEQLSLFIPVTGALSMATTATVRYRRFGTPSWANGHPLHRIRTDFTNTKGATATVVDGFAWPIIDVLPGTEYEVEVTLDDGSEAEVRSATFTTRTLPAAVPDGTPGVVISAGSSTAQIETLINNASPGDVVLIEDGIYDLGRDLKLALSGSADRPIYLRGTSRDGTVLRNLSGDRIIHFVGGRSSHLIVENMTLQGSGVDSGVAPGTAIDFHSSAAGSESVTLRNLTIVGADTAVKANDELFGFLVYDNRFVGTNDWNQDHYAYNGSGTPGRGDGTPDIEQNLFWNDAGVQLPGIGHAIFNNSFDSYGDTLSFCSHKGSNSRAECRGIHFYRNDVRDSGDDCAEVDYAFRNVTLYDNRCTNTGSFISLDPLFGGPFLAARNILVNTSRTPLKQNATLTGQFFYNNTQVLTAHRHSKHGGWWQSNNGALRAWGYRNNIFIYFGGARTLWMESSGNDPIDFTHNSWYPDGSWRSARQFTWNNSGGSGTTLSRARRKLTATQPVFSGAMQRHKDDNITVAQPFTEDIKLNSYYADKVSGIYTPTLRAGTAPKNSGVVIPNITDGYAGAAPDRGAIIDGRSPVIYGDRSQSDSRTIRSTSGSATKLEQD